MFYINDIKLVGRWVEDIRLLKTKSNTAMAKGCLALTDTERSSQNNQPISYYFDILLFGKLATNTFKFAGNKGHEVYISGKLTSRTKKNSNGGKEHVIEIVAKDVQFGNAPSNRANSTLNNTLEDDYADILNQEFNENYSCEYDSNYIDTDTNQISNSSTPNVQNVDW